MFIQDGGSAIYRANSGGGNVTIALTNATGTVTIEQSNGAGGWFPMVINGETIVLDSTNTVRSVYAAIDIKVTATGTSCDLWG